MNSLIDPDELATAVLQALGVITGGEEQRQQLTRWIEIYAGCVDRFDVGDGHGIEAQERYHERMAKSSGPSWQWYQWHLDHAEQCRQIAAIREQIRAGADPYLIWQAIGEIQPLEGCNHAGVIEGTAWGIYHYER